MSDIQWLAARRRGVVALFGTLAGALVAIHVVLQLVRFLGRHDHVFGLTPLFDLDAEANLPTFYATVQLLACAAMLACIAVAERRRQGRLAWPWAVLAWGFLFMAIDEFAAVHDRLGFEMDGAFGRNASGALLYAWVIPYAVIVAALGLYFVKFLLRLPRDTAIRFCIAGAIYVGAALGLEFLEGIQAKAHGENSVGYVVLTTIQEIGELFGLVVFLDALLRYIRDHDVALAAPPR